MRDSSNDIVIHTEHLSKQYGEVVAVNDLDLSVRAGGVFGLLGPNGSGKSTTIGMLLGLVAPTSGRVYLFGHSQPGITREDLHRIGAIVESPTFYPYLSGRANLRYFQGIGRRGRPGEIDDLLRLVDLGQAGDRPYHSYSLGMKQRLGIAYALLGDPALVFLDEPTNGLDPAGVAEVRDLTRRLGAGGRTVILSSHLLSEVQQVCDHVAILSQGRLLIQGQVADLLRAPGMIRLNTTDNERGAHLLRSLNSVEGVQPEDGMLLVRVPEERSWELSRLLAHEQIYVRELTPVQLSLEQFFLHVTGNAADDSRQVLIR